MRTILACLLVMLPAVVAVAQTPPNLIGITRNTPLIAQSDHATCTPLPNCVPGLPPSAFAWSGGSAWDSQTNSLWATSGQLLGRYNMNTCTTSCTPGPCPKSSPLAEATGLDVYDSANELWVIDDAGWITRCSNSCPPTVLTSCNTGLSLSGFTATTGITIDELRGVVFYSTADFAVGSGTIYAATLANPCAPFQSNPTIDCFTNPNQITGLAVDAGNSILYWTNGRGTFAWGYTYNPAGPSVTFTPISCCVQVAPLPDPYTDLSIRLGGATSTGTPCANGACPPCPMLHTLRTGPLLGTTLQLGLDFAAPNVPAWCVIGLGSCASGGTTSAPLCGPVLVPLAPVAFSLGFNMTGGTTGCTGTTTFLLPLPANPALVGLPLGSQCVALCAPTGTTMSNCLSWVLQ